MANESVQVVFGAETAGLQAGAARAAEAVRGMSAEISRVAAGAGAARVANDNLAASAKNSSADFKKMADEVAETAFQVTTFSGAQIEIAKGAIVGLQGALGTAGLAFTGLAAAAAAAMGAIGAAAIHMGEAAEKARSQFGLTGEGVARLQAVAGHAGAELGDLGKVLQDLGKNVEKGDKDVAAAASALGVSADQLKSKDLPGLLRTLQAAYDRNADSANKYAAFQKLLGDNFEKLYPQMQQGVSALDALYAAADRSGAAISGSLKDALAGTIGASREAGAAWEEFKQSVEGAVLALYEKFKPAIDGAIKGFTDLIHYIASAIQGFTSASREAGATSLALDGISTAAKALVTTLAAVTTGFETLLATAKLVLWEIVDSFRGATNAAKEFWKTITFQGGNVGGAIDKTGSDLKKNLQDYANTLRTIRSQFQTELSTTWGDGAKGAAPTQNLRQAGNPEPPDSGSKGPKDHSAQDELARARREIDDEIAEAQRGLARKEKLYDEEAKLYLISQDDKAAATRKAVDDEYAQELALLQKELALEGQKPAQRQAVLDKIKGLEAKHADEIVALNNQAAERTLQPWFRTIDTISNSLSSSIAGMIEHTKRLSDAVRDVSRAIVQQFVQMGVQMVAEWAKDIAAQVVLTVTGQQLETAATTTGVAARSSAIASGAVADIASKAASVIKSIFASAAETQAGVTGFLAPLLGPGAIAAGASAGASVAGLASAAAFDIGAYQIPHDMLSIVHKDELVMTAAQGQAFRNVLENAGGAPPPAAPQLGDFHAHFHTPDPQSFASWMRGSSGREIMKAMAGHVRDGAHLGLKGLNPA